MAPKNTPRPRPGRQSKQASNGDLPAEKPEDEAKKEKRGRVAGQPKENKKVEDTEVVKNKRGRPRKTELSNPKKGTQAHVTRPYRKRQREDEPGIEQPVRKRGRPSKQHQVENSKATKNVAGQKLKTAQKAKGVGRGKVNGVALSKKGKRIGRPPKQRVESEAEGSETEPTDKPAKRKRLAPEDRPPTKKYRTHGLYWDKTRAPKPLARPQQGAQGGKSKKSLAAAVRRVKLAGVGRVDGGILPLPLHVGLALMRPHVPVDYVLPYDLHWAHTHGLLPRKTLPPAPYQKIRKNLYVDVAKPTAREVEEHISVCLCQNDGTTDGCSGDECVNRATLTECTAGHCPMGDKCTNQRLQKRQWVKSLDVVPTEGKGYGVRTSKAIAKDTLVVEYLGEVISQKECKRRIAETYKESRHWYFIHHTAHTVIDGGTQGGIARFINHSCAPNCHIEKWNVNGEVRVAIFASRDIQPGEELSYDYKYREFGMAETQCHCGAATCPGVLGGKPLSLTPEPTATGRKGLKNGKKKKPGKRASSEEPKQRAPEPRNPLSERRERERERERARTDRIFLLRNLAKVGVAVTEEPGNEKPQTEKTEATSEKRQLVRVMRSILTAITKTRWRDTKLCKPFMALPSRARYPDYYQIVTSPLCIDDVEQRLRLGHYSDVTAMVDDLERIVSNALTYNKRRSEIGEAALELRRAVKQTVDEHQEKIQEVTGGLWTDVPSEAMADGAGVDSNPPAEPAEEPKAVTSSGPNTEIVSCRCRLNDSKGAMVQCNKCATWSHTDCVGLENCTSLDGVEFVCHKCVPKGTPINLNISAPPPKHGESGVEEEGLCYFRHLVYNKEPFRLEECVYVPVQEGVRTTTRTSTDTLAIVRIQNLWLDPQGQGYLFGYFYFRPHETFREHNQRFYPQELARSDIPTIRKLEDVVGRCAVMDVESYRNGRVAGIAAKDTYVVEFSYVDKARAWKRQKLLDFMPYSQDTTTYVRLPEPRVLQRNVQVVFDDQGSHQYRTVQVWGTQSGGTGSKKSHKKRVLDSGSEGPTSASKRRSTDQPGSARPVKLARVETTDAATPGRQEDKNPNMDKGRCKRLEKLLDSLPGAEHNSLDISYLLAQGTRNRARLQT